MANLVCTTLIIEVQTWVVLGKEQLQIRHGFLPTRFSQESIQCGCMLHQLQLGNRVEQVATLETKLPPQYLRYRLVEQLQGPMSGV